MTGWAGQKARISGCLGRGITSQTQWAASYKSRSGAALQSVGHLGSRVSNTSISGMKVSRR